MTSSPLLPCPHTQPPSQPPPERFGIAEETAKWKKVSYVFIGGVVIPFTTFSVIKHFAHHQCRSSGRRSGRPHGSGQTPSALALRPRSVSRNRPSLPPGGTYSIPTPHTLNPPCFPSTPSESEERPAFPYVTKRDKHMPWTLKGGSRCDLFDYACAEKERATLKATQAE